MYDLCYWDEFAECYVKFDEIQVEENSIVIDFGCFVSNIEYNGSLRFKDEYEIGIDSVFSEEEGYIVVSIYDPLVIEPTDPENPTEEFDYSELQVTIKTTSASEPTGVKFVYQLCYYDEELGDIVAFGNVEVDEYSTVESIGLFIGNVEYDGSLQFSTSKEILKGFIFTQTEGYILVSIVGVKDSEYQDEPEEKYSFKMNTIDPETITEADVLCTITCIVKESEADYFTGNHTCYVGATIADWVLYVEGEEYTFTVYGKDGTEVELNDAILCSDEYTIIPGDLAEEILIPIEAPDPEYITK